MAGICLVGALVGLAACAPSGSPGPRSTTTVPSSGGPVKRVSLPAIPLPPAQSYTVSADAIEALGCDECELGGTPDAARFFYGTMPLGAVGDLVGGSAADTRVALGNLFASGYFGGIYLRGNLAGGLADDLSPFAPLLDQVGALTQVGLDQIVGELTRIARSGTEQEVRDATTIWSAALAAIAGYNRGYLEVALQHPPAGVTVDPGAFTCASLFDCRSTQLPMPALDALAGQRDALNGPPSFQWLTVAMAANSIGNAAIPAGRDVWTGLLGSASFDAAGYRTIIDLSVGFLEVTQAALLANLAGPTGGDLALARRGLDATAGLVTWAGSYFLGLASSLPNSSLPTLTCS